MDTIFTTWKNSHTSHRLLLNFTNITDLERGENACKNIKKWHKNNKFKTPADGVISLSCLMVHILYHIFKIILSIPAKYIKYLMITHQWKYPLTKMKIKLHCKLR